ncbi:MAG: cation-translocating P-type ATPase [Victivallales bacterium]
MNLAMDTKNIKGLSELEAASRLAGEGFNELPSSRKRSIFQIAFGVVKEPMFLLLVACGIIYLCLGDKEEAMMLLGFVFVVMGITLYQERKTERALEALRDLSSPRARVIRDGIERRIPGREVVRGDMLVLSEGDRVPADSAVLECLNFSADESLLTGESVSVRKATISSNQKASCKPGGDDVPYVFSSTLIVQGYGIVEVKATGMHTEIGKIGKALQSVEQEETFLQRETGKLVRNLAIIGFVLCSIVIVFYGLLNSDWLNGFLAGITLAMAILPEEFPVVLTIFLALGAWRISRKQVLTRRVPAVETLGAATVLCVDKTGTLTLNKMTLVKLFSGGKFLDFKNDDAEQSLPEEFHELIEFSMLASQTDPFDPMEKAIKKTTEKFLVHTEHIHRDWKLMHEYPLSREMLALSRVWKSPDGTEYVVAAKGAPEAIADLCHLEEAETKEILGTISRMADEGLRVLGIAKAIFSEKELPRGQHEFKFEFIGLIGLSDPVRPSVPAAIEECHGAGIRVVMITGDYPGTARNIAKQIGLEHGSSIITGPEMDSMDEKELQKRVRDVNVFARVVPEQKLRIVNAFKANGEIVAMTGDGVNDAPALKSAHIGIAMGGRGTDVARESASLVLLNDDFTSIVEAVKLGRRIFDNIKKAISYIFAVHVPIAGLSLIPVLLKWPLILMPMHIVFMELIIDPACSVVFEAEPEEKDVMKRKPRNPLEKLFNKRTLFISIMQGMSVLIIVFAVYAISRGRGEAYARAMAFTSLIVANLGLILTNRSWSRTILSSLATPNKALWFVITGTCVFLGVVLYTPFFRQLFKFDVLHFDDVAVCVCAGIVGIVWFEVMKAFKYKYSLKGILQ